MSDAKALQAFFTRKISEIESNLERFLDRTVGYLKEAKDKLESVKNSDAADVQEYLKEITPIVECWDRKISVQLAREARTAQGSNLEYGLSHFLGGFKNSVHYTFCNFLLCLIVNETNLKMNLIFNTAEQRTRA